MRDTGQSAVHATITYSPNYPVEYITLRVEGIEHF